MKIRVGQGYDVHQWVAGRPCRLGGILIPSDKGPLGHSDADIVCHVLCDALLGAANMRNIDFIFRIKILFGRGWPRRFYCKSHGNDSGSGMGISECGCDGDFRSAQIKRAYSSDEGEFGPSDGNRRGSNFY